jgi:Ca-activated chloride channel family protein
VRTACGQGCPVFEEPVPLRRRPRHEQIQVFCTAFSANSSDPAADGDGVPGDAGADQTESIPCWPAAIYTFRMRGWRQPWIVCGLVTFTLFAPTETPAQSEGTYTLSVPVNEVSLTFHAEDAQGLPVNDLKVDELSLLDNGKAPRKVLAFQLMQDFPIRAGLLMDTSESMERGLPSNRAISIEYAQKLLRQQTDQAFVMDFGRLSNVIQPWTRDSNVLIAGIRRVSAYGERRVAGTAIFDTLYRACVYQFGKIDHAASANFILLFSDGEDNGSSLSLKEAVDACQRNNTAIYAFRTDSENGFGSSGPRTLSELASETGGRVFHDTGSESGVYEDLRAIEADLRNQYRLIYRPAELKHNGSFHRIELKPPERVDNIKIRSGYYAPAH